MIKENIIKAYNFAKEKHKGQMRKYSGLEYFCHPKGVARKADDLTKDVDIITASFLHDLVEDCDVTINEIFEMFGDRVGKLVEEVTTPKYDKTKFSKKDILLNKMLNMSDDGLTLKLLDRFDNIQYVDRDCKTIEQKSFVKKYYTETVFLLNEIKIKRNDLKNIHNSIIKMIEAELEYIKVKHLW